MKIIYYYDKVRVEMEHEEFDAERDVLMEMLARLEKK
jgi:hypothetical protein